MPLKREKAPLRSLLYLALLLLAGTLQAAPQPPAAAIASAHPLATQAGFEILDAGGNAFDAAVAVSAALAVVEPYSSGIGGGGFWLLHRASDARQVMLDGRERAPLAAHRDMYLDAQGQVVAGASMNGALAAGIPGEPAALAHLAENYGRLPLRRSLQAAIRLAREGFAVDEHYRRMARFRLPVLRASTAASAQFLVDGAIPELGYKIRQPELADTLERLARQGRAGFYAGETARLLVDAVRSAGGVWSLRDLAEYQVIERAPVRGHYRGWSVVSAAPPSSGGVVLLEMLNMLSGYALNELQAPARTHLLVEVMRRAYRDRAAYLGDPDFVAMPLRRLLSEDYAAGLMRSFDPQRASASDAAKKASPEGRDTTHFSILDRAGNRVAATLSINYPFGSGFVAAGTGVLLNDEMDDFSARPGVPNAYGLVGGQANAIAPGKRMLSSMSPTFVESERGVAILGTPGGSRIISMLLLGVLSLEQGGTASDWVEQPRFHHQYLPDRIQYEPGAFDAETVQALSDLGHDLEPLQRSYGDMQAVYWNLQDAAVTAASDPRGVGSAQVR